MVFSRFIWTILGGVAAIVVTAVLLGIYLQKPDLPVTVSVLVILLATESAFLVWYMIRIRRDLLRLILALRNEDPTLQFSKKGEDPYFSAIHKGFNEIIRNFRLVRLDREAEHQFFKATVNHISFGIIAFDHEGAVELVNTAFLDLFNQKELRQVEALEAISPGLPAWIKGLSRETECLKKIQLNGETHHLIFLVSRFRITRREITLVSVRDISREIDRNELEAWQKLMRILRHEILNSVSPISLISGNLSHMLQKEGAPVPINTLDQEEVEDIRTGLDTIHRRASGLSRFLDAYSNLYRTPELKPVETNALELLRRIRELYKEQTDRQGIDCFIDCDDKELTISMDERMIEQVLINLVKNAVEALDGSVNPAVTLSARSIGNDFILAVADNGPGIPDDQLEHIFIPFYSTREKGSGIGLSFAQHIMRLHQGRIHVHSLPGKGSKFQLVFRSGPGNLPK